jgi:cytoskeleton protein RodZ
MLARDWLDMGTRTVEMDSKLEITPLSLLNDGLKSLNELDLRLEQVEAQLHGSDVYRRAVDSLQQITAEQGADVQILIRAIGREAIRLALQVVTPSDEMAEPAEPAELTVVPESIVTSNPLSFANPLQTFMAKFQRPMKVSEVEELVPAPTREQLLVALGGAINQARTDRSMSLAQLHARTFVPLYHLQALELGDVDRLPEDVYLKGFLRRIENALTLDSGSLMVYLPEADGAVVSDLIPTWDQSKRIGLKGHRTVQAPPLYLAYTAIMAGGVCWLSAQSAPKTTLGPIQIDEFRPQAPPAQVKADSFGLPKSAGLGQKGNQASKASRVAHSVKVSVAPPEAMR